MKIVLAAMICLLMTSAAQASTVLFALQGMNPDGKSGYRGTVVTSDVADGPNGEKVATVTWQVERSRPIKGVALTTSDSPRRISISFPNTPVPGVALGVLMEDGTVRVQWFIGGQSAGREIWTPKR